jgi:hypothetical protein
VPVVGRHKYARPYRVRWTDRDGKRHSKAFHWRGNAQAELWWLLNTAGYGDARLVDTRRFMGDPDGGGYRMPDELAESRERWRQEIQKKEKP